MNVAPDLPSESQKNGMINGTYYTIFIFWSIKWLECSVHYFFNRDYGCYIFDDELLASKAIDVELQMLSDRKAGGEGPTLDCLCDAFLQVFLGMHLRTTSGTQQGNLEKLIDRLQQVEPNATMQLPI